MRREKGLKNLIYGLLGFAVTTLVGFVTPRLFLLRYGSEVTGLVSSVKEIFTYFALLEAGMGGAAVQAMYGPMAKGERGEISAILSAAERFYRRTGAVYAAGVAALALLYPLCVPSEIPYGTVAGVIALQGAAGLVKYLFASRLQLLLRVDGKNYILTNLSTAFTAVSNLARIALMQAGADILAVQAVFCAVDAAQVGLMALYVRRHYPWLDRKAQPDEASLSQRNSVLVHQLSGLVFSNTDTVILSVFCGFKAVSVYAMYHMIFGTVATVIRYFADSVSFALGQLFHSDRERFCRLQETYETYYLAVSFSLFAVAGIFVLPFLRLYTRDVSDVNYIDGWLPVLFMAYQVLNYGRKPSAAIIDYAGHFRQTRRRSLAETLINLAVSLAAVQALGIYGVLLGTVAALSYRANDMVLYANRVILNRSPWPTYRRWLRNAALLALCVGVGTLLPQEYGGYLPLLGAACAVGIATAALFIGVNTALEPTARQTAAETLRSFRK